MVEPIGYSLETRLVDIENFSAITAKLLKAQRHIFFKKSDNQAILESFGIEIVNLTNDSEGQEVLNNVSRGCFIANDKQVYDFSSNCSHELHHCHRELREFTIGVTSSIQSETHQIDGLTDLRFNLQVKNKSTDESSDQYVGIVLHSGIVFSYVRIISTLYVFNVHEVVDDPC